MNAGPRSLIHVVTVNFNSAAELAECLRSVPSEEFDSWLIVDNASSQAGEAEQLGNLESPKVKVLKLAHNSGFGSGVNSGVDHLKLGDDDIVVVLNPDTIVGPGTLPAMAAAVAAHPRSIVSPRILDAGDPPSIWFESGHLTIPGFRTQHRAPTGSRVQSIPFVPGTAMAMTGHVWRELGGFRTDLFMYWEDADLCVRAHEARIQLVTVTDAELVHLEGVSSGGARGAQHTGRSELYYFHMNRNRILVAMSHDQTRQGMRSLAFVLVSIAMLTTPLRRERRGRWSKARAAVRGLRDGLRLLRRADPRPAN